jgi:hypothetical protein
MLERDDVLLISLVCDITQKAPWRWRVAPNADVENRVNDG